MTMTKTTQIAIAATTIAGAFLDAPELLLDPDIEGALVCLEGDVALFVAALRSATADGGRFDAQQLLDQAPRSLHGFARERLASPEHKSASSAKRAILDAGRALRFDGVAVGAVNAAGGSS